MSLSTVLLNVTGVTKALDVISDLTGAGYGVNSFILIFLIGLFVTGIFVAAIWLYEKLEINN
ncbi:hypothetical protein [Methanohalobium evestigatum]|uniref:hypothetical protein n=1 Tax=Methanohalobium evestigatum TaxID=2322 RepID=UPI000677888C|nr:hypothetical protein [Methanohalobium evestigatum]